MLCFYAYCSYARGWVRTVRADVSLQQRQSMERLKLESLVGGNVTLRKPVGTLVVEAIYRNKAALLGFVEADEWYKLFLFCTQTC